MNIEFGKATMNDIYDLVQMRIDYLTEDYGVLTNEQTEKIKEALPSYYSNHLNKDLFVYTAKAEDIISCCFLLIFEKPSNPNFINGRTGTVLNVYTKPKFRRKGIAGELLEQLLTDSENMGLDFVELKATDSGYSLYKSLGFTDVKSKYHDMKIVF